jgi:hypothetical protein
LGLSVVDFNPTFFDVSIGLAAAAIAAFSNEFIQPDSAFGLHGNVGNGGRDKREING